MFTEKKSKFWRCAVCGYMHEGEAPPATCPKCSAGYEEFYAVNEEGFGFGEGIEEEKKDADDKEESLF